MVHFYIIIIIIIITYNACNVIITIKYYKTNLRLSQNMTYLVKLAEVAYIMHEINKPTFHGQEKTKPFNNF